MFSALRKAAFLYFSWESTSWTHLLQYFTSSIICTTSPRQEVVQLIFFVLLSPNNYVSEKLSLIISLCILHIILLIGYWGSCVSAERYGSIAFLSAEIAMRVVGSPTNIMCIKKWYLQWSSARSILSLHYMTLSMDNLPITAPFFQHYTGTLYCSIFSYCKTYYSISSFFCQAENSVFSHSRLDSH
mgnify:CR=1 FL=1